MLTPPILIGDIGGTNMRLGVLPDLGSPPTPLWVRPTSGFSDATAALREFLQTTGLGGHHCAAPSRASLSGPERKMLLDFRYRMLGQILIDLGDDELLDCRGKSLPQLRKGARRSHNNYRLDRSLPH